MVAPAAEMLLVPKWLCYYAYLFIICAVFLALFENRKL